MLQTHRKHPWSTASGKLCLAALATAVMFSLASHANAATIVAWGADSHGQVSDAPTGNDFTAITAGTNSGYALKSGGGSIVTWGQNGSHTLTANSGYTFTAITAGGSNFLALRSDGSVISWDGTATQTGGTVVQAAGSGVTYTAIAVGASGTGYALTNSQSILAWGTDTDGEVTNVPTIDTYKAIAAASATGIALTTGGSVVAWGSNASNMIANVPSGSNYTAIAGSVTGNAGLALDSSGSVHTWGYVYGLGGSDNIAMAYAGNNGLELRSDGSIDVAGRSGSVIDDLPAGNSFVAIAMGSGTGYALAVPEPTTGAVALLGLGGLLMLPRRRREEV